MSYQSTGNALFVGFEVIRGQVNGRTGSITLQHKGVFENGCAKSDFTIVSGSGTEDLAGIEGSGTFTSEEAGRASYRLELTD
jgi:hypothetical protein